MPLVYQQDINAHSKLALWHITEAEDFFLNEVPLIRDIQHPHKRLQHLAGRYLLRFLCPDFPLSLIRVAETRKPFLLNDPIHFSIAHCGDYAAAIISTRERVGIDVELVKEKINVVQHKFLSGYERDNMCEVTNEKLTLIWSCKEAMFKWYALGHVEFKSELILDMEQQLHKQGKVFARIEKETRHKLEISYRFFEALCLCWICGEELF